MLHKSQVLFRALALFGVVAQLPSTLAAQEPPNFPEPFESLVTPRSVQDEFTENVAPQDNLGIPVEAVITAVRLGHYLAITAVGWLPKGAKDLWIRNSGSATVALFRTPSGTAEGAAQTPFARTFFLDLNDPGAAVLRNVATLNVVQPGGQVQSVAVQELPVASRD